MEYFTYELLIPDAFLNDWYGYATNQISHFAAIGALLFCILAWAFQDKRLAFGLLAVGYGCIELLQRGGWADSLEDFAFVMLGAVCGWGIMVFSHKIMIYAVALGSALLAYGAWKRK